MKVVQINTTCGVGSTGNICVGISQALTNRNIENYIIYSSKSSGYKLGLSCSNDRYIKCQALKSKVIGNYGFNSVKATKKIIAELERIEPDIVHLHNVHGHDCNLNLLFSYFKKKNTKLVWTFHDCWAFTAYCTHFMMNNCNKWKTQCKNCVQKSHYSWFLDRSKEQYRRKKNLFEGLDLTIVTPSQWLADIVRESFLKEYPIKVINNGIDLDIFKYTDSYIKHNYKIENKKIVLGVSFDWDEKKGLDVFIELANRLPNEYRIVLVGTDESVDKLLPKEIISIHRTHSQEELAEIYSSADVFVNPTREDNYPTVNMEALACGIPVITFKTGGSPEIIDETCGLTIECDDVGILENEIIRVCEEKPYLYDQCLNRAKLFDKNERFKEYLRLYERAITARN